MATRCSRTLSFRGYAALTPGFHAFAVPYVDYTNGGAITTKWYTLFIPVGYDPALVYKVLCFLHGSDECGTDNAAQLTSAIGAYVSANAATFPDIVVFPQLLDSTNPAQITGTADQVSDTLNAIAFAAIDHAMRVAHCEDKVRLWGFSYGAFRGWGLLRARPNLIHRWLSVEGGIASIDLFRATGSSQATCQAYVVNNLGNKAIRTYHQKDDPQVSPSSNQGLAAAMAAAGIGEPTFRYTEKNPGSAHDNGWVESDSDAWSWLRG